MVVTGRWNFIALTAIVLISEVLYVDLLRFEARGHIGRLTVITFLLFALYAAAAWIVRNAGSGWALRVVIAAAVMFRITAIPVGLPPAAIPTRIAMMRDDLSGTREHFRPNLLLDDDVWRYLWDGRIAARAHNPYLAAPTDPQFDRFVDEPNWPAIRHNINHPELPTIYPPVAQLVFLASYAMAPGSVVMLKILLMAIDLAGIAVLVACLRRLNRPTSDVILYAWNPLVILMLVASAHPDGMAVTLLTLTVFLLLAGRERSAGIALGLAALAKLSPLVLLPLFIRGTGRAASLALAATLILGSLPFLLLHGGGLHGFAEFAGNWDFNSAAFQLLRGAMTPFVDDPGRLTRIVLGLLVAGIALAIARRPGRGPAFFASSGAATLGALLVLSPTLMPWYATWPLALAVMAGDRMIWIVFSALVCFSFPMTSDWQTHPGWLGLEFGAFVIAAACAFVYGRKSRAASSATVSARSTGSTGFFR